MRIGYQLAVLSEVLEEFNLPLSVDSVNLCEVSAELMEREGKLWIDWRDS